MNIFLNLLAAQKGGQLTRAYSFVECFIAHRTDCDDYLFVLASKELVENLPKHNTVITIKSSIPFSKSRFISPIARLIFENVYMPSRMKDLNVDVFLTFSHSLPLLTLSVPTIVGVSNVAPFDPRAFHAASIRGKVRLLLLRKNIISSCKKATSVFALSCLCQSYIAPYMPKSKIISVIPNGVRKQLRPSEPLESPCSDTYILTVGHFYSYKNIEVLLHAYALLPLYIKREFPLVIAGHPCDLDYYESIVASIEQYNLKPYVNIFTDLSGDQLRPLFANAHLFVFTSLVENCPNILLEAMSYGLPLLVCQQDPMPEFAESSVIYFSPTDASDLSRKILHLLKDPKLLSYYRAASFDQSKKYDWKIFTDSVLALCRQLTA
jgi:glycosyltransferase involved in cell wall biosynthesis